MKQLEPFIRRLTAPNPSVMTFEGTNTYLVGRGSVAVIDPGPDDPLHLEHILQSLRPEEKITHILVTHSHLDHSPLARALGERTGAPVLGFGDANEGRSVTMNELAQKSDIGGGEGIDHRFKPDVRIRDGEKIESEDWEITALHTPGHLSNHVCFSFNDVLFTGDHVMGWATSLVSPPDGDLGKFMKSCEKLRGRGDRTYYPGHGDVIAAPHKRLEWLIAHRRKREAEIVDALDKGHDQISNITRHVYSDLDSRLWPAASRNVLAHLIDLWERKYVNTDGMPRVDGHFSLK